MSRRASTPGWGTACLHALALLAGLLAGQPTQAGRACVAEAPEVQAITQGLDLALRTARALDDSGADVVLLARAGQDLARYGLRWSHVGLAYRDPQARPAGAWRVVHKLNDCAGAEAAVYRQGLGEFFLDRPHRYEAAFMALAPDLQARLLPLLQSQAALLQMHEPRYSMLAYPWATVYQQSNQWAVETLVLAAAGARDRAQAQAWLQFKGYTPTVLNLGPLTRLGARVGTANVAFDDHPNAKRFADRIETMSADSVFDWLARSGLGGVLQAVP